MTPTPRPANPVPEWALILAFTVVGAILRCAQLGQLGIDHFDEGVYCAAGAWIGLPGGISEYDPQAILYAPPGYPFLVGLAYWQFGVSDFSAIAVSILAGIAIIPLVGWLARYWLGHGYGAAASAFAALSGPNIVFSRMALTDATFLLLWMLGITVGIAFLTRPGPLSALLLGAVVGGAQLTKYNGWLIGAIVGCAGLAGIVVDPVQRTVRSILKTFGWGSLAAMIAIAVYLPWIRYVEKQIGYSALLRHQRSYLGEVSAWPSHLLTQLKQVVALSGGELWTIAATFLATAAAARLIGVDWKQLRSRPAALASGAVFLTLMFPATAGWWLGMGLAGLFLTRVEPTYRMLGACWVVLTILTPLYHPYARLWLPLEGLGWIFKAVFVVGLLHAVANLKPFRLALPYGEEPRRKWATLVLVGSLVCARGITTFVTPRAVPLAGMISRRDSFRVAAARLIDKIPPSVPYVRMLARPALWYYELGPLTRRGVGAIREESLDLLLSPGEGWAIVDTAQLRQEPNYAAAKARLHDQFIVIAEEPTTLSPATLLDIDVRAASGDLSQQVESLLLIRHRVEGDRR